MTTSIERIDIAAARRLGRTLTGTSPSASADEIADLVGGLRASADSAPHLIAEAAHLPGTEFARNRVLVVDRRTWLTHNARMVAAILARLGAPDQPPDPAPGQALASKRRQVGERLAAAGRGAQLGGLLGLISRKVLGQYDPFGHEPALLLVAPNVLEVERQLRVVPDDFRLWVCLHEQTHRAQFVAAPWLVDHLIGLVGEVIEAEGSDGLGAIIGRVRDQWNQPADQPSHGLILDVVSNDRARAMIDQLTAVMSLLEGHADVMMDEAAPAVIPTAAVLRARFERRRRATGRHALLGRLLGLDAKLAQYRDGASFCRAVIDTAGIDALNLVWQHAGHLPRRHELDDPRRWLLRVGA